MPGFWIKYFCCVVQLQVIEMSGVCAASDIWSVGCTVIELLTCVPPYYDLQPMPALFRIVQVDIRSALSYSSSY